MSTTKARRPYHGPPLKAAGAGNVRQETTSPRERAAMALLLRHEGWTWARIAEHLKYSDRGAAWHAAMNLAVKISPPTPEQRAAERVKAIARLEELWTALEPHLGSDDEAKRQHAMTTAGHLLLSYAALLGCRPSETPPAARLKEYGLAVIKE